MARPTGKPPGDAKVGTSKFGWCMTGQHAQCRVEFPGHRCGCKCHDTPEQTQ